MSHFLAPLKKFQKIFNTPTHNANLIYGGKDTFIQNGFRIFFLGYLSVTMEESGASSWQTLLNQNGEI